MDTIKLQERTSRELLNCYKKIVEMDRKDNVDDEDHMMTLTYAVASLAYGTFLRGNHLGYDDNLKQFKKEFCGMLDHLEEIHKQMPKGKK